MRPLGAALTLTLSGILLLAGCGSDGATSGQDPTPVPATSPATSAPAPSEQSAEPPSSSAGPSGPAVPGQAAAMAVRAFAHGGGELPPLAAQVDLYLGNAFTGFVTRAQGRDAQAWGTCTEVGDYAGRVCPISPLDVLAKYRRVAYVETPDSTCLQSYGPVPPDLRRLTHVAIVPAPGTVDSCIDDFAVQVFTDDSGDLAAVSLLLGEP